jgi:multiple antibiotic resistance protein
MLEMFIKPVAAIFGVMDPIGNVPIYLALTEKNDLAKARKLALNACVRAVVILLVFLLLGNAVLDAFSISIESFRIAGGIILVLIGLQIIFGLEASNKEAVEGEGEVDISVVPLATPLIAGPGCITTTIILSKTYGQLATAIGILVNLALSYLCFYYANLAVKMLGRKGMLVFGKVAALILVALGVEFIRSSL